MYLNVLSECIGNFFNDHNTVVFVDLSKNDNNSRFTFYGNTFILNNLAFQ